MGVKKIVKICTCHNLCFVQNLKRKIIISVSIAFRFRPVLSLDDEAFFDANSERLNKAINYKTKKEIS